MFDSAMFKAWPLAKSKGITSSSVRKCVDYKNGDFQCNAAMSLFKALKVRSVLVLSNHRGQLTVNAGFFSLILSRVPAVSLVCILHT